MNRKTLEKTATYLLSAAIIVFFCTEIILNLTPPISRDALIHHLAVPKLWLKHGGFYEISWADYSYYPMYMNLLYLISLYFKNDIAPKFIHLAFGMGTGLLIYFYLKHRFGRNWGLLGMVIFITTPIVVWLSTSAYIDLGMTFFTTASVMAFIKWRDTKYRQIGWLLISSICMGIAVGSKYNALIAWFIMTMMIMLSVVRDSRRQTAALGYGILFLVVTAAVASPWYMKNYFQTGNPLYPLFNSFFQSLHHQPVQEIIRHQASEKIGQLSFFKMRQVMYGETFWETLSIPIRMFFQGKDNSYQYFQGVLNPILIVFAPFILLKREHGRDKFLFVFFSTIFILTAYFLTEKQVRYLLPTLPFLAILAVMGIKSLADRLETGSILLTFKTAGLLSRTVVFCPVAMFLALNFFYLNNRVHTIKPFPYLLGKESREAFLKHHLLHYDAVEYINENLPDDAVIFTMFLGRRGYYLNRNYKNEPSFGMHNINQMITSSINEEKFVEYIRSMNVTHILMRTDLVDQYLQDNFSSEEIKRFLNLKKKYWKKIYQDEGYTIWDIRVKRSSQ